MNRKVLYDLLHATLKASVQRKNNVKHFQAIVFDGAMQSLGLSEIEWDVLTQLAQDLDFYEPDPVMRKEDASFCGEEKLCNEILEALRKLQVNQ